MKNLVLIIFIFSFISGISQNNMQTERIVSYYYDNAGNRVRRKSIFIIPPQFNTKTQIDTLVEQIDGKNIILYPNPVEQKLNILIKNYENEQGNVYVYSLNGSLIKTKKINSDKININFTNQVYGVYIVKISIADKTKEYSVIKK